MIWLDNIDINSCEALFAECGEKLPVLAYLRVSTPGQTDYSPETQLDHIRRHSDDKFGVDGYLLFVISDSGFSGKLPIYREGLKKSEYRPGLTLAAEILERGWAKHLVVYRCDRLCRNWRFWNEFWEDYLDRHGATLISSAEQLDSSTSTGKITIDIIMIQAERQRSGISERIRHGYAQRRKALLPLGGSGYGWRSEDKRHLKPGERPGIEPDLDEKAIVLRIAHWFLDEYDCRWIAHELSSMGVTKKSGKPWQPCNVKSILLNYKHAGLVKDNDGNLVPGRHWPERFFDESVRKRIIDRFEDYGTKTRLNPHERRVLDGLVHCGLCHEPMKNQMVRSMVPGAEASEILGRYRRA